MTYTEDVVVDDEEDAETEKARGEGETAVPVTEQDGDSKNEGVMHASFFSSFFSVAGVVPVCHRLINFGG